MFYLSRRGLLKAALGVSFSARVESAENCTTNASPALYVSGARRAENDYVAVMFDEHATLIATIPMTVRVHGVASHRGSGDVCVFARRPGLFMSTFAVQHPERVSVTNAISGRHFYGHGAYSMDGSLLYASENDYDQARGVLGVYDATRGYSRQGEWDTGGVGPHDVVRVPGSQWLIVANGGIQTHPETGREKLNLGSMQPSLVIIDSRTGRIAGKHVLPDHLHQLSLRHLACSRDGTVWFAGQYQGEGTRVAALAGVLSMDETLHSYNRGLSRSGLTLLTLPESLQSRTLNYLSSVALADERVIFTASHGGLVFSINRFSHQLEDSLAILDCSGVAGEAFSDGDYCFTSNTPLITSGTGEILHWSDLGPVSEGVHRLQWDNHVYRL